MKIYRVEYSRTYNTKYATVEAKSKSDANTGCCYLPKGSIKKLIGKELTWDDEPVELK